MQRFLLCLPGTEGSRDEGPRHKNGVSKDGRWVSPGQVKAAALWEEVEPGFRVFKPFLGSSAVLMNPEIPR